MWLPLASTWLMMAIELPFVQALVARLPNPAVNLAALGVGFSLILLFEAPVFMLTSASTALVEDRNSYRRMRNFALALSALLTLMLFVLLLPPVFSFISVRLLDLPPEIASCAYQTVIIMLPVPVCVAYRRFNQGILIRYNLAARVAIGTAVRFAAMALLAFILYLDGRLTGAAFGAAALTYGMAAEGLASRFLASPIIRKLADTSAVSQEPLSYWSMLKFYLPLGLMGIIIISAQPLITFFLARSPQPVESLAVFPVINSVTFFFVALMLASQEIIIACLGKQHEGFVPLKRFMQRLGALLLGLMLVLLCSPLALPWFTIVHGLTAELAGHVRLPAFIAPLMAMLSMLQIWQRAILVHAKRTIPITAASLVELAIVTAIMLAAVRFPLIANGALTAMTAMILGRGGAALLMFRHYRRVRREHLRGG